MRFLLILLLATLSFSLTLKTETQGDVKYENITGINKITYSDSSCMLHCNVVYEYLLSDIRKMTHVDDPVPVISKDVARHARVYLTPISVRFPVKSTYQVSIFNVLGKRVWHQRSIGSGQVHVRMPKLASGIYVLKVRTPEYTQSLKYGGIK